MEKRLIPAGPIVLAMGFFDGVHRGHQAVIKRAREIAREKGLPLVVLTYDHAPGIVSPQQFVDEYLVGFHAQTVVAGFDHTYGKEDIASMKLLPKYAAGRFEVVTVPKFTEDGSQEKVGSREIRKLIDAGNVEAANQALGYPYQTTGLVVHGLARGRTLGFPTINVEHPEEERIPGIGVYAVKVKLGKKWYDGMASVGHNITFGDANQLTVEINLFDFQQMVYGEEVVIRWYQYLRGEEKFTGADALVAQMKQDEQNARHILEKYK